MTTEVRVPALGESVSEATVATWFKKLGDAVAADELLCELETDKVTVELPSPFEGTLHKRMANEGDVVAAAILARNPPKRPELKFQIKNSPCYIGMNKNEPRLQQVRLAVMSAGLTWIRERSSQGKTPVSRASLFDVPFNERGLRTGVEASLRSLARQSPFARHRYRLIEMANMIRPQTLF
mgnify:CR=1 FL=1